MYMNKKLSISFPSKTFLIGEYAVLNSAPAILVNTTPLFEFIVTPKTKQSQEWVENYKMLIKESAITVQENKIYPSMIKNSFSFYKKIHLDSPAGQWLTLHPQIEQHWHIDFRDPHSGQGGFGCSSAQFNLMYFLTQISLEITHLKDTYSLWQSYKRLNFDGYAPSGADVVSQWMGKVCLFSFLDSRFHETDKHLRLRMQASTHKPFKVESVGWPFEDLDFLLLQTGVQLKTWKHLKNTSIKNLKKLTELSQQAASYVKNKDTKGFVSSIEEYNLCLEKQNLVHQNTLTLLKKIKTIKNITAAKGCGAMGAEVIVLFFHPQNKEQIKSELQDLFKNQAVVADSSAIVDGLQVSVIPVHI